MTKKFLQFLVFFFACFSSYSGSFISFLSTYGSCCKRYGSVFFRIISNFFCFSSSYLSSDQTSTELSATPPSPASAFRASQALVVNATAASLETAGPGKSSLFQRPYVQPVRQTIRRLVLLQPPRCLTRIKSLMDDPPATTSPTASCTANSTNGSTVSTSTLPAPASYVLQSLASSTQDHPAVRHVRYEPLLVLRVRPVAPR